MESDPNSLLELRSKNFEVVTMMILKNSINRNKLLIIQSSIHNKFYVIMNRQIHEKRFSC